MLNNLVNEKNSITNRQIIILLVLSRVFLIITNKKHMGGLDASCIDLAISSIISIVILAAFLPLIIWLSKKVIDTKVIKLILIPVFLYAMVDTLIVFINFYLKVSINPIPSWIIVLIFVASGIYAISMGIGCIGRFVGLISAPVILIAAAVSLINIKNLDLENIVLMNSFNIQKMGSMVSEHLLTNIEILLCIILSKRTVLQEKRSLSKNVITYFLIYVILEALINLLCEMLFSGFVFNLDYPYYNFLAVAEFSVFKRLDSVVLTVWTVTALVRVILFGYSAFMYIIELAYPILKKQRATENED